MLKLRSQTIKSYKLKETINIMKRYPYTYKMHNAQRNRDKNSLDQLRFTFKEAIINATRQVCIQNYQDQKTNRIMKQRNKRDK